jgi:hypothetical protein
MNTKNREILTYDSTAYKYKFYVVLVNGPNTQYKYRV